MKKFISGALDWWYPPACISCRALLSLSEPERFVCEDCRNLFEPIASPYCLKCGAPILLEEAEEAPASFYPPDGFSGYACEGDSLLSAMNSNVESLRKISPEMQIISNAPSCNLCLNKYFQFENNRAAFIYDEFLRELILGIKFGAKKRAAHGLGLVWADWIKKTEIKKYFSEISEEFILVPMPMHKKKQSERGFNQAEILTKPVADALKLPMSNLLIRMVDTPPQAGLHPIQRAENVKNVFSIAAGENVKGKNYILIDDIFTTGVSLNECAKTLKASGAAKILCMTLTITVKTVTN